MLHWSRLAVFWRESKRFPNVPNGATKGFTDVFSNIWMHHRPTSTLKDSYSTMEHVTPITAANKRSLDIKNVQFSHLLIFSLRQSDVVGRRLEKDVQSGELVVLVSPCNVSQQQWLISQILASRDFVPTSGHHLQFGTLPCSLTCSLTCTHIQQRSGTASVLVIIQGWEVVCVVTTLAMRCHNEIQLPSVKLKLQKHHNHVSIYIAHLHFVQISNNVLSKMMLDRWGKRSTELLRQCNEVSEVIVHVWCVARLFLVQIFTIWISFVALSNHSRHLNLCDTVEYNPKSIQIKW